MKKIKLSLNKEVIEQLDKVQISNIKGGENFTTLWGSNCNNSDPNAHECCIGCVTDTDSCTAYTTA